MALHLAGALRELLASGANDIDFKFQTMRDAYYQKRREQRITGQFFTYDGFLWKARIEHCVTTHRDNWFYRIEINVPTHTQFPATHRLLQVDEDQNATFVANVAQLLESLCAIKFDYRTVSIEYVPGALVWDVWNEDETLMLSIVWENRHALGKADSDARASFLDQQRSRVCAIVGQTWEDEEEKDEGL